MKKKKEKGYRYISKKKVCVTMRIVKKKKTTIQKNKTNKKSIHSLTTKKCQHALKKKTPNNSFCSKTGIREKESPLSPGCALLLCDEIVGDSRRGYRTKKKKEIMASHISPATHLGFLFTTLITA